MNTDELVKAVGKYFTLKAYNKKYNDYMAYIGDQVLGTIAIRGNSIYFQSSFIPLDRNSEVVYVCPGVNKKELEQSLKYLYMECLLNCRSNSFLRQVINMNNVCITIDVCYYSNSVKTVFENELEQAYIDYVVGGNYG